MKKVLLAVFITLIVAIGIFGYFHQHSPALEFEQTAGVFI